MILGLALLLTGAAAIIGILVYETAWKPRRRRAIEREHFRNKVR